MDQDVTFGDGDGIVTYNGGSNDNGMAVAIQPDGKIVVTGRQTSTEVHGIY